MLNKEAIRAAAEDCQYRSDTAGQLSGFVLVLLDALDEAEARAERAEKDAQ